MQEKVVGLTRAARKLQDALFELLVHLARFEEQEHATACRGVIRRVEVADKAKDELDVILEDLARTALSRGVAKKAGLEN